MKEITLQATDDNLSTVTDFISEELENAGISMKQIMQIVVAVEEIFVNISHYAYTPNVGNATVSIDITEKEDCREIIISFTDSGTPYNPLEHQDPDITLSVEERQIGGLGIFMVKKSMDDLHYEYENGQNHFTVIKRV